MSKERIITVVLAVVLSVIVSSVMQGLAQTFEFPHHPVPELDHRHVVFSPDSTYQGAFELRQYRTQDPITGQWFFFQILTSVNAPVYGSPSTGNGIDCSEAAAINLDCGQ